MRIGYKLKLESPVKNRVNPKIHGMTRVDFQFTLNPNHIFKWERNIITNNEVKGSKGV